LVHEGEDLHGEANQPGVVPGPDATLSGQVPPNHMATAITGLAALFQSTRSEVAEMRAELVSLRSNSQATAAPVSAPVAPPVIPQVVTQAFAPTIANLRVDVNLAAQAEQLVADLSSNISGTPKPLLNNVKRGLARSGGDLAPSVITPWPQDYVL
jgi:hypothetical protein